MTTDNLLERWKRMAFGLVLAIPAFVLGTSRNLGWLQGWTDGLIRTIDYYPLSLGWLHMVGHHSAQHGAFDAGVDWLLLALTAPVVAYSTLSILRDAGARRTIELILATGALLIYLCSALALFGLLHGPVYFESAALVMALISTTRYLETRHALKTAVPQSGP